MSKTKANYAAITDQMIAAVIAGLYSFNSENDAILVLKQIRENFIPSKLAEPSDKELVLWIRNYEITEDEEKKGCKGNFGTIKVAAAKKGKFTLRISKLVVDAAKHPERKYQKHQHPNWGHPILRSVKKKKTYKNIEQAQKDLQFLQEEYPLVTIPAQGKLYVMIFEKLNNKSAVNKYILTIKAGPDNNFIIDCAENIPVKKTAAEPAKPAATNVEAVGEFTQKVLLKRAAKRKPPAKKPSILPPKD